MGPGAILVVLRGRAAQEGLACVVERFYVWLDSLGQNSVRLFAFWIMSVVL